MLKPFLILSSVTLPVTLGPSIKYVTLFLEIFYPPPPVTLCHTSLDPPESTSHISDPRFLKGLVQKTRTKAPLYKFCFNCSQGFLSRGFCQGVFCLVGFVGVVFVR